MTDPADIRRVCDLSPLELLEAAFAMCAPYGWTTGHWVVALHLDDGQVRRAVPELVDNRVSRATIGRRQLGGPLADGRGQAA